MQEYNPSVARSSIFSREFDNVDFYVKCLILNVVDKASFCFYHKRQLILFKINKAYLLTKDSLWNSCLQLWAREELWLAIQCSVDARFAKSRAAKGGRSEN